MNVLVLGSGGREHALSWKIAQSSLCEKLFIAPGNAGTSEVGENVNIGVTDFTSIKTFVIENEIDMLVVGPEDPLVKGIYDFFKNDIALSEVCVIGPSKEGAQLEGSKEYSKQFMQRHDIPTAAYDSFTKDNLNDGFDFLETLEPPYVLKADGLAAGKGVLIIDNLYEAKKELKAMLADAKFGDASSKVVIEEFLDGIELSVFVLTDGKNYKILPSAKDYKRIGEGDTGLNTGGMGAISPVPFADKFFIERVEDRIIKPTIKGLQDEGIEYKGFIFIGLMNVNGDPKVIEYNVRMGDPETEVVIPRIKSDLLNLFKGISKGTFGEQDFYVDEDVATTVMLVSGGYPEHYEKGKSIQGLEEVENSLVFHAGTRQENNKVMTNGGRVMAITSFGRTMEDALIKSFDNAEKVQFDGKYYRKDIGFDLKEEKV
ncbi:MAG: phosphoribosylamine--glycine ligase [Flavobacteriales bacterium]|nr:phosphoribosylamine--glycine ligase [Flavobacteriales bacterium]|tara:strand:+ start:328 stop:1614 length:1287 start_codon:yes stop_codon:yes gene_type:complete